MQTENDASARKISQKTVFPHSSHHYVLTNFVFSCGCKYIVCTVRNLSNRIVEHIPSWLRSEGTGVLKSAITKRLYQTKHRIDSDKAFKVIYRVRSWSCCYSQKVSPILYAKINCGEPRFQPVRAFFHIPPSFFLYKVYLVTHYLNFSCLLILQTETPTHLLLSYFTVPHPFDWLVNIFLLVHTWLILFCMPRSFVKVVVLQLMRTAEILRALYITV